MTLSINYSRVSDRSTLLLYHLYEKWKLWDVLLFFWQVKASACCIKSYNWLFSCFSYIILLIEICIIGIVSCGNLLLVKGNPEYFTCWSGHMKQSVKKQQLVPGIEPHPQWYKSTTITTAPTSLTVTDLYKQCCVCLLYFHQCIK